MAKIKVETVKDEMQLLLSNVPGFEGDVFEMKVPESIGPTDRSRWFDIIQFTWQEEADGNWSGRGWVEGEIEYTVDMKLGEDYVDFIIHLTNKSNESWKETQAFNCFSNRYAPSVRDHDCKRHWVRSSGEFKRLIEIPRVFGPRPSLQLYNVEGAPAGKDIPFVAAFQSTPEDVAIEGWFAIQARDGKHMVAVASKPVLYTFQNREYSCIHSSPTFGALEPGETGSAITRVYFVEATVEAWHERMRSEFETIDPENL
ncbi:MAG: hypothetical protein ABFS10_02325 [Bacteroidota bacterium]